LLARRFLYAIAGVIFLILVAATVWNLFPEQLLRLAFVPGGAYSSKEAGPAPDYSKGTAWISRPDLAVDPSRWAPPGHPRAAKPQIAVFFVEPTTYYSKASWNAPLADPDSRQWLDVFAASEASAFNGVGAIWAPRYRQATLGAFLTDKPEGAKAIDFAYQDVARAFDAFLAQVPPDQPIIIAGHSQGTRHLMRLMREHIAGTPIAKRIVAAYLIGWPISIEADTPAMGLPACTKTGEARCIISWQSFAEPAEPRQFQDIFDNIPGLTGKTRRGTHMICINPLTGSPAGAAPASANRGTLVPSADYTSGTLTAGLIPARCDSSGFLLIGGPPEGFGRFVMTGNNYHVFDYALFWANLRADVAARSAAFLKP